LPFAYVYVTILLMDIKTVNCRWILDSRGNPTVEVEITTANGAIGRAAVPSGASTGEHEALELRDNQQAFNGKGVNRALKNITDKISPIIIGLDASDQHSLDQKLIELDGTDNKSNLGANATLGISLAVAHAAAAAKAVPLYQHIGMLHGTNEFSLPRPMVNIINGGQHATGGTEIQEFMIYPRTTTSFQRTVQLAAEVFASLKKLLLEHNLPTTVGDEGGFAPAIANSEHVLQLLVDAIEIAGYTPGEDVELALDVAASEFYTDNQYHLSTTPEAVDRSGMIDWLKQLTTSFPISSIEDGLDEDDWDGWTEMTDQLGSNIQIVGDDFLVTDQKRLQQAIDNNACNAILIKPNQIGTLSETLQAIKLAQEYNFGTIISHRSGETEDTTIAHLAVGVNAGQIKTGSVSRSERTAKYNELLRIEEQLG